MYLSIFSLCGVCKNNLTFKCKTCVVCLKLNNFGPLYSIGIMLKIFTNISHNKEFSILKVSFLVKLFKDLKTLWGKKAININILSDGLSFFLFVEYSLV